MSLTPADLDAVCGLVIDLCGVYLDETKGYLVESRLSDVVKRAGCANYADLVRKVRYEAQPALRNEVINAITTNETLFFRDATLYDELQRRILPTLIASKRQSSYSKRIRIWSAACSTGQEPYSVAMMLFELIPDVLSWDIHILGSDVSDDAVSRASRGWYSKHEVARGVSQQRLNRFFQQEGDGWRVTDELRSLISFERRNLLEPFASAGRYDIVFCRNVAIYFTLEARRDLFQRIAATLVPGGMLFVGSQESLCDLGSRFAPQVCERAVYFQPNNPVATPGVR